MKSANLLGINLRGLTMNKTTKDEILTLCGEDVIVDLEEKGYSILPTGRLSDEDKKQRKSVPVTFIVKLPDLENWNDWYV